MNSDEDPMRETLVFSTLLFAACGGGSGDDPAPSNIIDDPVGSFDVAEEPPATVGDDPVSVPGGVDDLPEQSDALIPATAQDDGPSLLALTPSSPLPTPGLSSGGRLDSTSSDFETFRTTPSTADLACDPLTDAMLRSRGVPDLLHDHPSEPGVIIRSWWYASQGYSVLFEEGYATCTAEDFRYLQASVAEVADYLQLLPGVSSVPAGELVVEEPAVEEPVEEPVVEEPVVETPVVEEPAVEEPVEEPVVEERVVETPVVEEPAVEEEPVVEQPVEEPVVEEPVVEEPVVKQPIAEEEPVVETPVVEEEEPVEDRNCSDFGTREEAQAYFDGNGDNDRDRLDADNDGEACEDDPRFERPVEQPVVEEETVVEAQPSNVPTLAELDTDGNGDVNCPDFSSQSQAQAFFEANNPSDDPFRLDRDKDGRVCESLPG